MKQCRLNGLMDFDKNVVYPFFEDEGICKGVCNALGYDVNKAFEARYKKVYEVYTLGKLKFKKFIFVCLGKKKDIDEYKYIECFREVSGHIDEDAIFVGHHAGDDQSRIAFLFMKTYLVSSYRECKVNGEDKKIADIEIFMHDGEDIEKEIKEAVCISNGVNLAKRLADTPANYMTSIDLMEEARELAERYNLEIEVLDNDALGEMGAGAILAVNQGSEYPAVVIPLMAGPRPLMNRNLLYTAVTRARKCVTLVGDDRVFVQMIENVQEQKRYCGLRERLMEKLAE